MANQSSATVGGTQMAKVVVGDRTFQVELEKLVELVKTTAPASVHLMPSSDSKVDRLENEIVDEVRTRIHKQLRSLSDAGIDLDSIGAPRDLADSMAAVLPASHPFDEIAGPFYDTASLSKWLGVSRQRLHQKVKADQLLACPLDDGGNVYPTWQFTSNGAVLAGVRETLSLLSEGTNDNWQKALWFSAPSEQLDNLSPKDWLLTGRSPAEVIDLATETAARWRR